MTKYQQYTPDQAWLNARLREMDRAIADANRRAMGGQQAATASAGSSGGSGTDNYYVQAFNSSASWIVTVPASFGRQPSVDIYSTTGERVYADVVASSTTVTVTFASPYSGSVLLT